VAQKFRITYATMSADNEELQQAYDEAAERMKAELGKPYPVVVNGEERWHDETYDGRRELLRIAWSKIIVAKASQQGGHFDPRRLTYVPAT